MKLALLIAVVSGLTGNACIGQDIPENERNAIKDAIRSLVRPDDIFDIVLESRLDARTEIPIESARVYGMPVRVNGLCRVWYLPVRKVDGQWESALDPGSYEPEYQALLPHDERGNECETRTWDRYININSPIDDGTLRLILEGLQEFVIAGEAAEFACPEARPCRISLDAVLAIDVVPWRGSFHYRVRYDVVGSDGTFFLYVRQATEGVEIVRWGTIIR